MFPAPAEKRPRSLFQSWAAGWGWKESDGVRGTGRCGGPGGAAFATPASRACAGL
jgi:hypothetical protein